MNDLEQELGEARLQRQRLEDERLAWTAYLESQAGEDGQLEFDSPEAVARALVEERFRSATLLEESGRTKPELAEKDQMISSLEEEKKKLQAQLEKAKTSGGGGSGGDAKAKARLERQKALAVKEVEYLRAQLTALDAEESTMELASFDEAKAQRIKELETMVDNYRSEVQKLHDDLAKVEVPAPSEPVGSKRPRDESDDNEQLGQLLRKNRKLQDEFSALQTSASSLQKELSVTQERLKAAETHSKTRILSLRSNPTGNHEAIKTETLNTLRAENAALLSQLRVDSGTSSKNTRSSAGQIQTIPLASLEAAQLEVKDSRKFGVVRVPSSEKE
jgi:mitotic spindle assembly checkpoint protein MAD1